MWVILVLFGILVKSVNQCQTIGKYLPVIVDKGS